MIHKSALLFFSLIFLSSSVRSQTDSAALGLGYTRLPQFEVDSNLVRSKTQPWTVRSFSKQEISRFPFRGIENYLPLVPGVAHINNEFHIRGSRSNETGYFIDGIDVTNPMYGTAGVNLIPEAIEQLDVHTGPYGASLGSYNGGLVMSQMKTGGDKLSVTANIQSDKLVSPGRQFLNTTAQGYENVVGTISGPLPWLDIRFFVAAQRTAMANRQPMFLEPFRYDLVEDGGYSPGNAGKPLPGPVAFERNWIPGNRYKRSTFQGNGTMQYMGVFFQAMGSYEEEEYPLGSEWPSALTNYFNQNRNRISRTKTKFGALQASYSLADILTASVSFSFFDRYSRIFDPLFGNNWQVYSDSSANAPYVDVSAWQNRFYPPTPLSTIYYFTFTRPGSPNTSYSKDRQSESRWSFDLSSRISPSFELKAGVSIDLWRMRSFRINSLSSLTSAISYWGTFASPYEKRVNYIRYVSNYGYTFLGEESDGYNLNGAPNVLLDQPYRPTFTSTYIEGQFKRDDALLRIGLRYETFDPKFKTTPKTLNPATNEYDYNDNEYNSTLGIMDESLIMGSEPISFLLPRVNLTVHPSNKTSFYAGYGAYAQLPALDPLYVSSLTFSNRISPEDRSPYGGELAFDVRPERTRQFEAGFEHSINSRLALSVSAYYKVLSNQVQLARYYNSSGNPLFTQYRNDGSGLAKGFEIEINLARSMDLAAHFSYAYSVARGTSSNPRSNQVLVSDQTFPPTPITLRPYDYEQQHRVTMFIDAVIEDEDEPFLGGWGATAVFSLLAGHPYTRENEIDSYGAYGPWNVGTATLRDRRFADPIEARNASLTPFTINLDLRLSKRFSIEVIDVLVCVDVLNVFNTKNVLNVYPKTGTTNDDSWLGSFYASSYTSIPNYVSFYTDINLKNRWSYTGATGFDIYGTPRQIQMGVKVVM